LTLLPCPPTTPTSYTRFTACAAHSTFGPIPATCRPLKVATCRAPSCHRLLLASSSFLLHVAAASASRFHHHPATPAPAPLCLHGMPFPPSSPATQARFLPCPALSHLCSCRFPCNVPFQSAATCHSEPSSGIPATVVASTPTAGPPSELSTLPNLKLFP
jgi:hypothetical protein